MTTQVRTSDTMHPGFTLVELLIALCIALVAVTITVDLLVRQQRFYRAVDEILDTRSVLRDGLDVLTTDLRTASVADTVRFASDTAVEFYSTIGASTLCVDPAGSRLVIPPDTLVSGNVLTAFTAQPDTGDYVVIYHDSSAVAPVPGWQRLRIAALTTVATGAACPPSSGFTTAGDVAGSARAYEISIVPSAVVAGSKGDPIRFVRRVRYDVYRSSDARWYLGYRRCGVGGCNAVQPVSGPYEAGSDPPLKFTYFDSDGVHLPTPGTSDRVARIDVTLRAGTTAALQLPGLFSLLRNDSATVSIAPRNAQ